MYLLSLSNYKYLLSPSFYDLSGVYFLSSHGTGLSLGIQPEMKQNQHINQTQDMEENKHQTEEILVTTR